jgi:hypothetical protein
MKPFIPGRPDWWQWPTVLSLDAPAVALLWQWLFARIGGAPLRWPHGFILGASVWLAYAADRWIEGWRLRPGQIQTQRHDFYQRWRWPLCVFWCGVLGADLTVSARCLTSREFNAGLLLLLPVLAYLLSHQLIHRRHPWRAPKEICVALLFGGGVSVFPLARPGVAVHPMLGPLGLFCLLCFANCALISVWEQAVDEAHGQTSLALQFRRTRTFARALPWLLALATLGFAWAADGPVRTTLVCVVTSGVLLGLLDLAQSRLGARLARVLADVALMTPLAVLLFEWLLFP